MTKISRYSTDVNITGNDKWIGSDAQNFLITKNFTPNNLAGFFNDNNVIDIGLSIRYRYQTLDPGEDREQGTISFETEIGPQVNFSSITTFLLAKNTLKQNDVSQYLGFLVGGTVVISRSSNVNTFGYYTISSIDPYLPDSNFFVVTLSFITGNGFIYEDLDYLISLVDKSAGGGSVEWGDITGDITNQTDLINYISSQITTPNLQAVADQGNTTTTELEVTDIAGEQYNTISNTQMLIVDDPNGLHHSFNINGISRLSPTGATTIQYENPTGTGIINIPNVVNSIETFALLSDIPTLTSELTNDSGYLTQDNVEEYPDLASFPVTGVIGTIYIALDTELLYVWDGIGYVLTSPVQTGITGLGATNKIALFTSPTTLGSSIIQQVSGCVYVNRINSPTVGNTMFSIQREAGQSQIDFSLGNPTIPQESVIQSNNTEGLALNSRGYLSLRAGLTYTEGLRVLGTGQIQLTQTPATGTTSDKLLVRDISGNVKQIDYPTGGGIPHTTASGTDTYTATVTGVVAYADGDAYLVRFTNGNTTGATLNINTLGAVPLYRNNDGPLLGGDIADAGEMLCVYNSTSNVFQVIGISPNSLYAYVTNADSVAITKGMPVYAFGGTGDRMTVKRAKNTGDATSAQTVGLVLSASIAAGQKGLIMMQGLLDGLSILPTATWADGDSVYLGATDGSITNVKPYAPNHLVYLGVVTTASNGSAGRMYVRVQNGYELDELHNVQAQSPTLKDTLWYDNTVSPPQWKTASLQTILGAASTSTNGYLTSSDWNTFNDKQFKTIKQGYTQLTGVTGVNVLASLLIPANWLASGDSIEITIYGNKGLTASPINYSLYHSTTLNGTTNAIATNVTISINTRQSLIVRDLSLDGTSLRNTTAITATSTIPSVTTGTPPTTTFDPTINNYITLTVNPTVSTEVCGFLQFFITKI